MPAAARARSTQTTSTRSPSARASRSEGARRDPRPRHVDGLRQTRLVGEGVDHRHKKYVFVNMADTRMGIEYYQSLGYDFVRPDSGVRLATGRTTRSNTTEGIQHRGHVLMSIDRDRYDEIVESGPDGDTGQAFADEMEARVIRRRTFDPIRGQGGLEGFVRGRHYDIENHTSPLKLEGEIDDRDEAALRMRFDPREG